MLTWFGITLSERIASEVPGTHAHRCVTNHPTLGVRATGSGARISALPVRAGQLPWTLAVPDALGFAIRWTTQEFR